MLYKVKDFLIPFAAVAKEGKERKKKKRKHKKGKTPEHTIITK